MQSVTTFLWILAALGGVAFAWTVALTLSRASGGHHAGPAPLPDRSGKTRYELDNEHPFNAAAFFVVMLCIGGLVAAILALSLT